MSSCRRLLRCLTTLLLFAVSGSNSAASVTTISNTQLSTITFDGKGSGQSSYSTLVLESVTVQAGKTVTISLDGSALSSATISGLLVQSGAVVVISGSGALSRPVRLSMQGSSFVGGGLVVRGLFGTGSMLWVGKNSWTLTQVSSAMNTAASLASSQMIVGVGLSSVTLDTQTSLVFEACTLTCTSPSTTVTCAPMQSISSLSILQSSVLLLRTLSISVVATAANSEIPSRSHALLFQGAVFVSNNSTIRVNSSELNGGAIYNAQSLVLGNAAGSTVRFESGSGLLVESSLVTIAGSANGNPVWFDSVVSLIGQSFIKFSRTQLVSSANNRFLYSQSTLSLDSSSSMIFSRTALSGGTRNEVLYATMNVPATVAVVTLQCSTLRGAPLTTLNNPQAPTLLTTVILRCVTLTKSNTTSLSLPLPSADHTASSTESTWFTSTQSTSAGGLSSSITVSSTLTSSSTATAIKASASRSSSLSASREVSSSTTMTQRDYKPYHTATRSQRQPSDTASTSGSWSPTSAYSVSQGTRTHPLSSTSSPSIVEASTTQTNTPTATARATDTLSQSRRTPSRSRFASTEHSPSLSLSAPFPTQSSSISLPSSSSISFPSSSPSRSLSAFTRRLTLTAPQTNSPQRPHTRTDDVYSTAASWSRATHTAAQSGSASPSTRTATAATRTATVVPHCSVPFNASGVSAAVAAAAMCAALPFATTCVALDGPASAFKVAVPLLPWYTAPAPSVTVVIAASVLLPWVATNWTDGFVSVGAITLGSGGMALVVSVVSRVNTWNSVALAGGASGDGGAPPRVECALRFVCGVDNATVAMTLRAEPVLIPRTQQVAATTAALAGAATGGDLASAASMLLLSSLSCASRVSRSASSSSGELSVASFLVSPFYASGSAAMAWGNLGLVALFACVHAVAVRGLSAVREASFWAYAQDLLRFPALSLQLADLWLPGAALGATAGVVDGAGAPAVAALLLVLAYPVASFAATVLYVLPRCGWDAYTVYPTAGSWDAFWYPEGRWAPKSIRNACGPLMASMTRRWGALGSAVRALNVLLGVANGLEGSAVCSRVLLALVALHAAMAALLVVLRPLRLPMHRCMRPLGHALLAAVCALAYARAEAVAGGRPTVAVDSASSVLQVLYAVVSLWTVVWGQWIGIREAQWDAAAARGKKGGAEAGAGDEALPRRSEFTDVARTVVQAVWYGGGGVGEEVPSVFVRRTVEPSHAVARLTDDRDALDVPLVLSPAADILPPLPPLAGEDGDSDDPSSDTESIVFPLPTEQSDGLDALATAPVAQFFGIDDYFIAAEGSK